MEAWLVWVVRNKAYEVMFVNYGTEPTVIMQFTTEQEARRWAEDRFYRKRQYEIHHVRIERITEESPND